MKSPGQTPSFFFLDVRSSEADRFSAFVEHEAPDARVECVPMMRGRVVRLDGRRPEEVDAREDARWVLEGDRGITYSTDLPEGSTLVAGDWWPADYKGPPLVSVEAQVAEGLGLKIGDEIVVNVLGRNIAARIANLRKVNWRSLGINFEPLRPLHDILTDYKKILERVFEPAAYARRLDRLATLLDRSGRPEPHKEDRRRRLASLQTVNRILDAMPGGRSKFWDSFINCARTNPAALSAVVSLMAMYAHLGPFSRQVIGEIDRRIAADAAFKNAPAVPYVRGESVAMAGSRLN